MADRQNTHYCRRIETGRCSQRGYFPRPQGTNNMRARLVRNQDRVPETSNERYQQYRDKQFHEPLFGRSAVGVIRSSCRPRVLPTPSTLAKPHLNFRNQHYSSTWCSIVILFRRLSGSQDGTRTPSLPAASRSGKNTPGATYLPVSLGRRLRASGHGNIKLALLLPGTLLAAAFSRETSCTLGLTLSWHHTSGQDMIKQYTQHKRNPLAVSLSSLQSSSVVLSPPAKSTMSTSSFWHPA